MATVARLIVQVGADTTNLRTGLNRGLGLLRQFAKSSKDLGSRSPLFGNINPATARNASIAAERFAKQQAEVVRRNLEAGFARGLTNLREKLLDGMLGKQGGINQDEFTKRLRGLNQQFNAALQREMDSLDARGLLTDRVRAGLVSQFKDLGDEAGKALKDKLVSKLQIMDEVGKKLTQTLTVPIVAGLGAATKAAADFEFKMLRVAALADQVPGSSGFKALEISARDIETVQKFGFTASQAADGMEILAQAGFKVNEIMDINKTVLKLAAVENTDLGTAAQIATSAMTAFSFRADQAAHVADVLAKASIDSKATLTDLGVSMTYVGGTARAIGLNFEETTAALALMSQEGFRGTLAGTALRGAMLKLTRPTKEQARIMQKLGVQTVDSSGKLLKLSAIIKQFEDAEKKFGAFKVGADILQLFGQRAGPGFGALVRQGSEALIEFENRLDKANGTLDRVAKQQVSGAVGAFRQLKAAVVELAIAIGNSGLLEVVSNTLRKFSDWTRTLSQFNPEALRLITIILAIVAAIGPLLSAFAKLRLAILLLGRTTAALFTNPAFLVIGAVILAIGAALLKQAEAARIAAEAQDEYNAALEGLDQSTLLKKQAFEQAQLNKLLDDRARLTNKLKQQQQFEVASGQTNGFSANAGITSTLPSARTAEELDEVNRVIKRYESNLKAIQHQLNATTAATKQQEQAQNDLKAAIDLALAQIEEGVFSFDPNDTSKGGKGKTIIDLLLEQMDLASAKLKALQDQFNSLGRGAGAGTNVLAGARFGLDAQTRELNAVGDTYSKIIKLVQQKIALNKADLNDLQGLEQAAEKYRKALGLEDTIKLKPTLDVSVPLFDNKKITKALQQLQTVADRTRAVREQLEIAQSAGQKSLANDLQRKLDEDEKVLLAIRNAVAGLIASDSTLNDAAISSIFADIQKALQGTGLEIQNLDDRTKSWNKTVDLLQRSWRQIVKVAKGLGVIDEQMRAALDSINVAIDGVQMLTKALKDAKANGKIDILATIGGVAGVVAGIAGLAGGILGGDDEMKRIVEDNTNALQDLRSELAKQQVQGLGGQNEVLKFLNSFEFNPGTEILHNVVTDKSVLGADDEEARKFVEKQAKAFGLTFAQIEAIAKDFGITIVKDGKLVHDGLFKLRDALAEAGEALKTFSQTMDTQQTLLEVKQRLGGVAQTPAQEVQNDLTILQQFAPEIAKFLGQFGDITTASAEELRKRLLTLIAAIEAGQIKAEDFGAFGSADEFLQWLNTVTDSLDSLTNATDQAAGAMLNVPTVFKIERARADAQFSDTVDRLFKNGDFPIKPNIDPTALKDPTALFKELVTKLEEISTSSTPAITDPLRSMATTLNNMASSSPRDLLASLDSVRDAVLSLNRDGDSILRSSESGGTTVINVTVESDDISTREKANALADGIVSKLQRRATAKGKPTTYWGQV